MLTIIAEYKSQHPSAPCPEALLPLFGHGHIIKTNHFFGGRVEATFNTEQPSALVQAYRHSMAESKLTFISVRPGVAISSGMNPFSSK